MGFTRRYTKEDIANNLFYQLPKFLFEGDLKHLSNDARVLYSLLKDRHELSLSNGWVNDAGEVYFIFSRENMGEILGLCDKTITKAVNNLKKYDLIEEERRGQGKPNLIFLKLVSVDNTKTRKIYDSRNEENTLQDSYNLRPNKNYNNNTDLNKSVSQSGGSELDALPEEGQTDGQSQQEIKDILDHSQIELFQDEDLKETLKEVIRQAYQDPSTRATIKKLTLEHIDIAKNLYTEQQELKTIKQPLIYFKKCLISAILESGLKKLF